MDLTARPSTEWAVRRAIRRGGIYGGESQPARSLRTRMIAQVGTPSSGQRRPGDRASSPRVRWRRVGRGRDARGPEEETEEPSETPEDRRGRQGRGMSTMPTGGAIRDRTAAGYFSPTSVSPMGSPRLDDASSSEDAYVLIHEKKLSEPAGAWLPRARGGGGSRGKPASSSSPEDVNHEGEALADPRGQQGCAAASSIRGP